LWIQPKYPEKTVDLSQIIDKLYHIMLYRIWCMNSARNTRMHQMRCYFEKRSIWIIILLINVYWSWWICCSEYRAWRGVLDTTLCSNDIIP
jgi:hypothetical protein